MTLPGDADGMRDTLGIGTVVAPVGSFRLKPAHTRTNGEAAGAGTEGPPHGACTPRLSPSPHPSPAQPSLRPPQDSRHPGPPLGPQSAAQPLLGLAPRPLGRLLADLFRSLAHIGKHGHAVWQPLQEPAAHEQLCLLRAVSD